MLAEETRYKILKCLEASPNASQRELARELGISLGKVNYCIRALINKGYLKAERFKNNPSKLSYAYLLTPKGIEEKAKLTITFLKQKLNEYEKIKADIEVLRRDVMAARKER